MQPPQNTGSFGAPIGGSDSLKQAMARRGLDVGAGQQMSPGAAGQSPVPGAVPVTDPSLMPQAQTPEAPESEYTIATKALAGIIKSENNMKQTMVKAQTGGY